jgi:hypothetical protein
VVAVGIGFDLPYFLMVDETDVAGCEGERNVFDPKSQRMCYWKEQIQ